MQKRYLPMKSGKRQRPSSGPQARSLHSPWEPDLAHLSDPRLEDFSAKNKTRAAALEKIIWVAGHAGPISLACRQGKYTIAIRETGALSVKRIAQGARAKPHTILEKSIKASSLRDKYANQKAAEVVERKLAKMDLLGFIGHWSDFGLLGVRIVPDEALQKAWPEWLDHVVSDYQANAWYVPLDLDQPLGGPGIQQLKQVRDWRTFLYTGDYDLHEVYGGRGGGSHGQIMEASKDKIELLNSLNAAISEKYPARSGHAEIEGNTVHVHGVHAMFQHGDQATYQMNQVLEAEGKFSHAKLVPAVASESGDPIAWCVRGPWYVTNNRKEHQIFRALIHQAMPSLWRNKEK